LLEKGASRSLATAEPERTRKQRERRRSGRQAPLVVVMLALEGSICSHDHGDSTLVSYAMLGGREKFFEIW